MWGFGRACTPTLGKGCLINSSPQLLLPSLQRSFYADHYNYFILMFLFQQGFDLVTIFSTKERNATERERKANEGVEAKEKEGKGE